MSSLAAPALAADAWPRVLVRRVGLGSPLPWAAASLAAVALAGAWEGALVVALPEELVFRGVLQGELEPRLGPARAVVVAAIAFALAHVAGGQGVHGALTLLPALAFGFLRAASRSVWPAVAAHALANAWWG